MKVFQKLQIELSGTPEQFIAIVEKKLTKGWQRNPKREAELAKHGGLRQYCFAIDRTPDWPTAFLWLACKEPAALYVSNIVPQEVGKIPMSQYNLILTAFCEEIAKPAAEEARASVELTSDYASIKSILGEDVGQRLESFSHSANMSTGSSHPSDMERWCSFIIAAHSAGTKLDGHTLGRLLREELQWSEDMSYGLVHEYEFARDLLQHYDKSSLGPGI